MLKSIKKYGILLLLAMVVFSSCVDKNARKNNYPVPGTDFTLPVGQVFTIDSLLKMRQAVGTYKFTADASVYGVVTADETSGNLYKASFIQDGDKAIELYMKSTSGLRIGDSVRVYLKDATLSEYSGTPQIQDLNPNNIIVIANNINIIPDTINTLDVDLSYRCRLVTFEHVEFAASVRNSTFAPDDAYGQFALVQYDENCNLQDSSIIVRTSNYASFANTKLPQGSGTITGIITYYSGSSSVFQLTIRSMSEVNMNNDPCEESVIIDDPEGTGTQDDPYNMAAAILNQYSSDTLWIRGYIVGATNIAANEVITNDDQISWTAPFDAAGCINNVILADHADERDINKCVVVSLPNNAPSGIRGINLQEHPENLGKVLTVRGILKTNYGKAGMKNANEYILN